MQSTYWAQLSAIADEQSMKANQGGLSRDSQAANSTISFKAMTVSIGCWAYKTSAMMYGLLKVPAVVP